MSRDIFGKALIDFQNGSYSEDILTYSSLGEKDVLPLPYLFRDYDSMPIIEQKALDLCRGKVLDVGCGSGSHSLHLQKKGFEVTGLDASEGAVAVAKLRGVRHVIHSNIFDYSGMKFDTILLLMNGIGIAGTLNEADRLMTQLESLLKRGGQILLDSSDIIYMFELDEDGGYWIPNNGKYYGEVEFRMMYKGLKSTPFNWLYLDFKSLKQIAEQHNFSCEMICEGPHYDYLARLKVQS